MKKLLSTALIVLAAALPLAAQNHREESDENKQGGAAAMIAKMKEEAKTYYAGTDTAEYGVRYRLRYKFNKENNLTYLEDRIVMVRPDVTLDMSYQGMGETRWTLEHPDGKGGGDRSLAYHLTPSFYYFYPETGRTVKTYRIIAKEFLLDDSTVRNDWAITDEQKKIGEYNCRKATLRKDGRSWTAWFTTDLPHRAAPRTLTGLPGVVLEVSDADGEVRWMFNGLVENIPDSKLYIKFPENLTPIQADRFETIVRAFGRSNNSYVQNSGVMEMSKTYYPEKLRPSTGVHALNVDNPIERPDSK